MSEYWLVDIEELGDLIFGSIQISNFRFLEPNTSVPSLPPNEINRFNTFWIKIQVSRPGHFLISKRN